jgi:glycosyltransferase involved in cell wall biosynthesis
MKVLFCSNEQLLPLSGGGTVGNLKIVEKLVKNKNEVTVATPLYVDKNEIEKKYKIRIESFSPFYMQKNVSFRGPKYILYSFLFGFHFLRLMIKDRYDVVIVRNALLGFPVGILRLFFPKKTKYILSFTDFLSGFLMENKRYPNCLVRIFLLVEQKTAGLFDKVFVITPEMKKVLVERGIKAGRIFVSYDGVEASIFNPDNLTQAEVKRAKRKLGFEKNIVLFHGTIDAHGAEMIEKVVKNTLKKDMSVNFVFIGAGKMYDGLKKRIKAKNVRFLGYVHHEELPTLIYAADVGIIPYEKNYNLNMVLTLKLLEYLSMGTRVVSTNLKSIRNLFGKYDFIRFSNDAEEFSENIVSSLGKGKSDEAVMIIRKDFSWDKVTDRICAGVK